MSYTYKIQHVSSSKFSLKCPYKMDAEFLTIHNTYNNASASNEARYHNSNSNQVSFHIAIDDIEAVEVIPLNRNAFHCGDGTGAKSGNRTSIGIEICYSKSGGEKYEKAENNAAHLTAKMLHERGWGINKVRTHQSWSGKYCPHRILDKPNGWKLFLNKVQKELDKLNNNGGETLTMEQYKELKSLIESQAKEIQALKLEKASRVDHTQSTVKEMQDALDWIYEKGILKGDGNGLNASGSLTRQEFATMLKRYDELKKNK